MQCPTAWRILPAGCSSRSAGSTEPWFITGTNLSAFPVMTAVSVFRTVCQAAGGADRGTVYVRVDYTDKSGRVYHNNYCLDKQKNMNYPKVDLQTEVRSIEGGYEVTVSTDKFARAVCLSVADNEVYIATIILMSSRRAACRYRSGRDCLPKRSTLR